MFHIESQYASDKSVDFQRIWHFNAIVEYICGPVIVKTVRQYLAESMAEPINGQPYGCELCGKRSCGVLWVDYVPPGYLLVRDECDNRETYL